MSVTTEPKVGGDESEDWTGLGKDFLLDPVVCPPEGQEWWVGGMSMDPKTDPATDIFSAENLKQTADTPIDGQGTDELAELMQRLSKGSCPDPDALQKLADIRGLTMEEVTAQYKTFALLKKQHQIIAEETGKEGTEGLDAEKFPDHMGSPAQLRFGSYVGQAYGIDPVFGALLSPTGGLVGPGNDAYAAEDGTAVGYHGEAHDAAGYLLNFQGSGPGYSYIDEGLPSLLESAVLDPSDEMSGQVPGMLFWEEFVENRREQWALSSATEAVGGLAGAGADGLGWAADVALDVGEGTSDVLADAGAWLGGKGGEALDGLTTAGGTAWDWGQERLDEVLKGTSDAAAVTTQWLGETADEGWDALTSGSGGEIVDWAVDTGGDVWEGLTDNGALGWIADTSTEALGGTVDAVAGATNWALNAGGEALDGVLDAGQAAAAWTTERGGEAWEGISGALGDAKDWAGGKVTDLANMGMLEANQAWVIGNVLWDKVTGGDESDTP